jgi:perosamine synthetase
MELGKLRRRYDSVSIEVVLEMDAFVPVSRPYVWGGEKGKVCEAIDRGWISSRGGFLEEFESNFAARVGVAHAVAASSGTAAVHLALSVLNLSAGDEVIVPDFTMISPILAVLACGALPIPIDADVTWNIDPDAIKRAVTPKTRAIVVVHTYGHPARIDRIMEIAQRYNLLVVEDAAEALGATAFGRPIGSFGHLAIFSFYANKVLTTGEGGMVVTNEARLSERLRAKRNLCFGADDENRFVHNEIGFNYRMTNLQAAFGIVQLEHLDEAIAAKISIARQYEKLLSGIPGLTLPPDSSWGPNVYWVYGILIGAAFGLDRRSVQIELLRNRIETRRFFHPLHRQPIMPKSGVRGTYPRSVELADKGLYLPSYIGMESTIVRQVAENLARLAGTGTRS